MLVKIEGKEGLVRDLSSGAILNTSRTDYENYMIKRNKELQAQEAQSKQAEEINNIKDEIREIKEMLLALMNK